MLLFELVENREKPRVDFSTRGIISYTRLKFCCLSRAPTLPPNQTIPKPAKASTKLRLRTPKVATPAPSNLIPVRKVRVESGFSCSAGMVDC